MTQDPQDQPDQGGRQPYSGQPAPPPPPPPPPGYSQGYGQQSQAPVSPSDARMWSLFAQLGGIFFSFIPALVIYVIYKDRDPFIRRHSAQALNFQIFVLIGYAISFVLTFILIGILTFLVLGVAAIVFPILAAVAANKGEQYTYPFIPQLVT